MQPFDWFKKWTVRSRRDRRAARKRAPRLRRAPLRLEALEERSLLSAGTLDPTFGTGGVAKTDLIGPGYDVAQDFAFDGSGRVVLVGQTDVGGTGGLALTRVNAADGSLDTSFGQDGRVTLASVGGGRAVTLQDDGKIVT